jgi:phage shock protein C
LPVYLLLWLLMPKTHLPYQQSVQQNSQEFGQTVARLGQQFGEEVGRIGQQIGQEATQMGREAREMFAGQRSGGKQAGQGGPGVYGQQPPAPSEYRFDPLTGQPIRPEDANTGKTVNLRIDTPEYPAQYVPPQVPPYAPPPRRARNWKGLGAVLIGIGGLILLDQIGLSMDFVFPALMIAAGAILVLRKR